MVHKIRDNKSRGSVGGFLKENIKRGSKLSFVSAYFTIYAYDRLKEQFQHIDSIRFLFGEPTFLNSIDPDKQQSKNFVIEKDSLVVPIESRLTQKAVAKECANWLREKAEIKSMVKPNFLHGKAYHIEQASGIQKAIVGSSNFTVNGLGLGDSSNIELNVVVDSDNDRDELKAWFDEIWNDKTGLVEDVKEDVLKYIEQLYTDNSPEFIYFKTLFHIFENYLDEQSKGGLLNEKIGFFETQIWNSLFEFQKDGVKGAINKILKHNGCIIADSVGLGKTYEALAVIKYFELLNLRVLVLCPKKLAANWTLYQSRQNNALNPLANDRFDYTLLYHTDIGRTTGRSDANGIDLSNFSWGAYDLVVIDESHNFRGNPMEKTKDDGVTTMNRAKWLMEKIIKSGTKTKVLLLSATPVNNNLKDLRNQIHLITEGKNDALLETAHIKDISQTLQTAQTHFTKWADKKNQNRSVKALMERLDSSFFKLLDELTIARSRKHIVSFYNTTDIGKFPKRLKPISIYPSIDTQDRFLSYESIDKKIRDYRLAVFNPSQFVKEEFKSLYEAKAGQQVMSFTQEDRENYLIGMMKVNFLKRLESSIESFEISMNRTILKIEALVKKIEAFKNNQLSVPEGSLEGIEPDDDEIEDNGDEQELWQVGKKLKFDLAHLRLEDWLTALNKDKEALLDLYNTACAITPNRDAKLAELKKEIDKKIKTPINDKNKKVLIFTAFADTAHYLYENLLDFASEHGVNIALVAGSETRTTFGKNDFGSILTNFSPISKNRSKMQNMPSDGEIDILVATDCISEGQNLQDCDTVINYDIHWNPVRIIQRFGRIDRIGSKNEKIRLINFWPTKDLDGYINLKERVESRMALVDVTATADDNVLATEQIEELVTEELKYRNKQLKKLREEIIDLEEMDEGISLTDFTLDDFRIELLKFLDAHRQKLESSPFGLYAVVPSPANPYSQKEFGKSEAEIIKPGVIYCLKQKNSSKNSENLNPLSPYFLVYIRDDGTVRYNYSNAKQILEIMRLLCQDVKEPCSELCKLFAKETDDGADVTGYADLLKNASIEIKNMLNKKASSALSISRQAVLPTKNEQISGMESFELVTWLVIK